MEECLVTCQNHKGLTRCLRLIPPQDESPSAVSTPHDHGHCANVPSEHGSHVALQPQAVRVLKEHPGIVFKCSWNTRNSILEEAGPELVFAKQIVVRLEDHVGITVTPGSCFTKWVCASGKLPGLFRIRALECV